MPSDILKNKFKGNKDCEGCIHRTFTYPKCRCKRNPHVQEYLPDEFRTVSNNTMNDRLSRIIRRNKTKVGK